MKKVEEDFFFFLTELKVEQVTMNGQWALSLHGCTLVAPEAPTSPPTTCLNEPSPQLLKKGLIRHMALEVGHYNYPCLSHRPTLSQWWSQRKLDSMRGSGGG